MAKLDGYVEVIDYRMPSYRRDGVTEVSFAKQARYLSLYLLKKPVLDAHRAALAGLDVGKGCLRYRRGTKSIGSSSPCCSPRPARATPTSAERSRPGGGA